MWDVRLPIFIAEYTVMFTVFENIIQKDFEFIVLGNNQSDAYSITDLGSEAGGSLQHKTHGLPWQHWVGEGPPPGKGIDL
jgi:hypothetical protein